MIHGAEWLRVVNQTKINDPLLLSLLCMGVLNWKAPNNHLHQATQAIRHGTTIALRFLPQDNEAWVLGKEGDQKMFEILLTLSFIGGWCWGGVESPYDTNLSYRGWHREALTGGFDDDQRNPGHHWEEQWHLLWEVGGDTQPYQSLLGRGSSPEEPGGGSRGLVRSSTNCPPILPKYYSRTGGDRHWVDCDSYQVGEVGLLLPRLLVVTGSACCLSCSNALLCSVSCYWHWASALRCAFMSLSCSACSLCRFCHWRFI